MPTYEYVCDKCSHGFEIFQRMADKALTKCPECKCKKLRRVFGTPFFTITGGSNMTVGTLAEKNRKRIGESEIQEREAKVAAQAEKKARNTPPPVGERIERPKDAPWWRKGTKRPNTALNKLTPQQKKDYILKGKK